MQWLKARFFGVTFFLLGLLLLGYGISRGGYFWLLCWPAVSLLAAGLAYLWLGPMVFGKQPDGRRRWVSRLVLVPYCSVNWLGWRFLRFVVTEDCWNEAAPNVYIGRRAYLHELPPDVGLVVDLTAEFIAPREVRENQRYRSFPILDAFVPHSLDDVLALVNELKDSPEVVYIHCAEGHGRAAMMVAILLIAKGHHPDGETALAHLKKVRPRTELRPHQRAALESWIPLILAQASSTPQTDESER